MTAAGNGQAVDPVNRVGTWHNNSLFKDVHTQSPTTVAHYGGQAVSGMDDRFDFQLTTAEVTSGEGFSYINNTYRAFGNNGTTYNTDVDNVSNTYPFDMVNFDTNHTRAQLLTNLASVTDHLPVVADFRLPAKMGVQFGAVPLFVTMGSTVPILVSVTNTAPVTFSGFADELDYSIVVAGSLTGGLIDINPAASGPRDTNVFLNTSTLGPQTGKITVTATSDQASSPQFISNINFTVITAFLAADFNNNGAVDGFDLSAWKSHAGLPSGAQNPTATPTATARLTPPTSSSGSGRSASSQRESPPWLRRPSPRPPSSRSSPRWR